MRYRRPPLARIVAELLAIDVKHPPKFFSAKIERRMQRGHVSDKHLGLGYWLRRIDRKHRMHVVCRCEIWDVEARAYRFATWKDVLVEVDPGTECEDVVMEYPKGSGRLWRLMQNDERAFPYRDDQDERSRRDYYDEDDPRQRRACDPAVALQPAGRGVSLHARRMRLAREHEALALVRHSGGRELHRRADAPVGGHRPDLERRAADSRLEGRPAPSGRRVLQPAL